MARVVPPPQARIIEVRRRRVMLDSDLAKLYEVETKALLQQVRRNGQRFPDDFMCQLSGSEWGELEVTICDLKSGHGGRRTRPYAFTEHGVARLDRVEQLVGSKLKTHEKQLAEIFTVLRRLTAPPAKPRHPVGFRVEEEED